MRENIWMHIQKSPLLLDDWLMRDYLDGRSKKPATLMNDVSSDDWFVRDAMTDQILMVSVPCDGNCGYHAMMDALWKDTITSSVTEFHHELRQ